MNWVKNLRLSVHALSRARTRTVLSSSGMAIGIAAMVTLLGLSNGAERSFKAALEEMGKNLLAVGAERTRAGALRGAGREVETLTTADARAIAEVVEGVERAAPIALAQLEARYGRRSRRTTVIGTTSDFRLTNNQILSSGRFLDDLDLAGLARVAVIGSDVKETLFGAAAPVGQRLLIGGTPFTVIGVLEEKGLDPTGSTQDDRILVPVSTAQKRLLKVDHVDRIFVQAVSIERIGAAREGVRALLRARHGILDDDAVDDFSIRDQNAVLAAIAASDRSLSRLLLALAILTLGLGGIGLLGVALLSVRERQGEIGLRLAVGAMPHHVLIQFLSETVMTALFGALSGLAIGGVATILGERLIGWRLVVTWDALLYPFLISLAIALVSGTWPAARASKLDPIVALRTE